MSPKRPHTAPSPRPPASPTSCPTPSSSGGSEPPSKRRKTRSLPSSRPIKLHIIEAKLDAKTLSDLISLVESRPCRQGKRNVALPRKMAQEHHPLELQLCLNANEADTIVTAVQMRKRLERHLDWSLAKEKAIVTPQWLIDSVKHDRAMPYSDYAALNDPYDETTPNGPDTDRGELVPSSPHPVPSSSLHPTPAPTSTPVLPKNSKLSYRARFCCARASPLICPNQELAEQFDIVRRSRALEGEDISALTYARAVAVVKAYPFPITERELIKEIPELPYIGPKKSSMIREYVTQGFITESKTIQASSRFQSLSAFSSVYGIGAITARKLYSLGLRTLEDLDRYFEVNHTTQDSESVRTAVERAVERDEGDDSVQQGLADVSIKLGLALRHEFAEKIPRTEVEEMHQIVKSELGHIQKGCVSTIVGGYRRGKPESNDVDIVITHSDSRKAGEIGKKLVRRLYEQGLVTHVMHLSGFHKPDALRTTKGTLETILTVFVLPPNESRRRVHRRLDLIFALPEVYWTAITGWTGSTMFQRDLRFWSKERGLKFDSSGITRRHDSKRFYPKSEAEVFEMLGLEWVDPTLRNADV